MKMKKNTTTTNSHDMPPLVDASQWYASGTRLSYDAVTHCIMDASTTTPTPTKKRPRVLQVFAKTVGGASASSDHSNNNGTRARCDTQTTVSTIGSASVSSLSTTSGSSHPNNNNTTTTTTTMSQLEASLAALVQQPHDDLHQREQPPSSSWQRWITMLPGVPEGSFGFSQLEQVLQQQQQQQQHDSCDNALPPRLYLDYLGMGDSDTPGASVSNNTSNSTKAVPLDDNKADSLFKPPLPTTTASNSHDSTNYYSTHARADLVEALWHHHGIDRTVLVAVGDASTCVAMELMQRFQRRLLHGTPFPRIEHLLILQGSILAPSQKQLHLQAMRSTWKHNGMLGPWAAQLAQTSNLAMRQWLQPRLQGCRSSSNQPAPEDSRANDDDDDDDDNDSEATPVTSVSSTSKDNSSTCRKRFVSRQLRTVVRRHQGCALFYHATQLAQEHSAHKWKWHLPKLYKEFAQHQGITVTLVGSGTYYKKQWKQTIQYLGQDYSNKSVGGMQTKTLTTCPKAVSTTSLLLLSSQAQLQELAQCVVQLGRQEIPGSRRPRHAQEPPLAVDNDWSPPASISDDDPSPEEWQALKNWGSHDDDGVPPATSIEFDPDHDDDMMIMLRLEEDYLLFGGESCVL